MRDHWGNPTSPEQPKDESFASALDRYASAFRVLAVLGAIGLVIVSVPAGEGCTDTVLNTCVERGWTVTSVVIALWASAVGLLIGGKCPAELAPAPTPVPVVSTSHSSPLWENLFVDIGPPPVGSA